MQMFLFSYLMIIYETILIHLLNSGRELSLAQQYSVVAALSFPLFWLAGAGSAVFWIIGQFLVLSYNILYFLIKLNANYISHVTLEICAIKHIVTY